MPCTSRAGTLSNQNHRVGTLCKQNHLDRKKRKCPNIYIQEGKRLERFIRQDSIYYDRLHDFPATIPRCYKDA